MRHSLHLGARPATTRHPIARATTRSLAATATLAIVLAACGGAAGPGGSDGEDLGTMDGRWELTSGTSADGAVPLVPTAPITLVIEGEQWGGTAACNTYGGEVRVAGGRISTDGFFVTEMYCEDDDVMASESAYLAALQEATTLATDGDTLELTGPGVTLTFDRQPETADAALVGTRWVLTGLVEGDGPDAAVSSVAADAELELDEDGSLAGSTGCNRLMGGFSLDGDALVLEGPIATTRMACTDEMASSQERHVLEVLEAGPLTVRLSGEQLELIAQDGRGLLYRAG